MVYDCQAVDNQTIKFCILPTRHVCSILRIYPTQTVPDFICGVFTNGAVTIFLLILVELVKARE